MRVSDILKVKGSEVVRIAEDRSVLEAVKLLTERNIGALIVVDAGERIAGIISERDVLRECAVRAEALGTTRISQVMTRDVITGSPEADLEDVQAVMTTRCVRHLPIVEGRRLVGMISMGDVVKTLHKRLENENIDLKDFITQRYIG